LTPPLHQQLLSKVLALEEVAPALLQLLLGLKLLLHLALEQVLQQPQHLPRQLAQ